MLRFNILCLIFCAFGAACGERSTSGEETTPGPVTETDKHRYNLNPSDEILYEPIDSLATDSLAADTSGK